MLALPSSLLSVERVQTQSALHQYKRQAETEAQEGPPLFIQNSLFPACVETAESFGGLCSVSASFAYKP